MKKVVKKTKQERGWWKKRNESRRAKQEAHATRFIDPDAFANAVQHLADQAAAAAVILRNA